MRIISGIHKGRQFHPPRKNPARPTTDIAKEGLFNILENNLDIASTTFLDLFGGTGSISYEMGSRGCRDITVVELHRPNVQFIKRTAEELDLPVTVLQEDVFKFIANCTGQFDLIFAGPPYRLKRIPELPDLIFNNGLLKQNGWFVLEHSPQHNFETDERCRAVRNYGQTNFSIFIRKE
jgi:16S rRNA (guanine(966)-N(2))-methyltransferase RsmD